MRRKALALTMAGLLVMVSLSACNVHGSPHSKEFPYSASDDVVIRALNFLKSRQSPDGRVCDPMTTAWVTMAICAAGEDFREWGKIIDYLKESISKLDPNKVTDWEREALAVVACDQNPRDFGGVDFVEKIKSFYDGEQIGDRNMLNDDFWGAIALVSCGVDREDIVIQNVKNYIINHQNPDGGWGVSITGGSDVDSTSAAIMALMACGEDKNSTTIQKALDFLRSKQSETGGFVSWGTPNSASTAWAIMAISSTGGNPSKWMKNGVSPVDYLISLQRDDGAFKWNETVEMNAEWMTSYAIPALLGKYYPVKVYQDHANNSSSLWTGWIRIEGKDRTIWEGNVTVGDTSVSAINVSSGEIEEHYIPYPSVLGALIEASKAGGFTYTIEYYPSWDALYVKSIDNYTDWWHYWVDYKLPMVSCDKYQLTENDSEILFGYVESWEAHLLKISVDRNRVKVNEVFRVTVEDENGNAVENATVYVGTYTFRTDSNGTAEVKIPRSGTYTVYAEKSGYVRSEKIKIEVERSSFILWLLEVLIYIIKTIIQRFLQFAKLLIMETLCTLKAKLQLLFD